MGFESATPTKLPSEFLFLDFTWLMRDVSLFRGFYIAGIMIAGIAALQRITGRVGFAWLIIPIIGLQPFFQYLGQTRKVANEELVEAVPGFSQLGVLDFKHGGELPLPIHPFLVRARKTAETHPGHDYQA
jgi:hypothetical protein